MSETRFTPGPWTKTDFDGGRMSEVRVEGRLACLLHCFGKKPTNEDTANLNLIAAAPELYEALERIESNPCLKDMNYYTQEAVKSALAKARGEP
ncbi:MAG: hypothetical protein RLZ25_1062 [Pseudomonadota bacterium]|jgi:hypothetical protein